MRKYRIDTLAWLGLAFVAGSYLITILLQWIGNRSLLLGAGRLLGVCALAGFGLCLVAVVMGLFSLRTADKQQKQRALIAISVGMAVLVVCIFYMYIAWQLGALQHPVR
ncbi:hypothetical protein [Fibrella aestuarina]|uniref:hypothetical protein n=1 Tax=Fibrella aestuarina TaxID=651143 RepID=UPI00059C8057|nr:hypothetical protein [Fibrella aestuarina]